MTGMVGTAGLIKGYNNDFTQIRAPAVRLDDFVRRDICLLKADVEGYEPQAKSPQYQRPKSTSHLFAHYRLLQTSSRSLPRHKY